MKFDEDLGVIWRVIWNDLGFVWMNGMAFIFLPLEKMQKKKNLGRSPFFFSWLPSRHSTVYDRVCICYTYKNKNIYIYIYTWVL